MYFHSFFLSVYIEYSGECPAYGILIPTDTLHHFGCFWSDTNKKLKDSPVQLFVDKFYTASRFFTSDLLTDFNNIYASCTVSERQCLGALFWVLLPSSVCKSSRRIQMPHPQNRMTFPPLHMDEAKADKFLLQICSPAAL